MTSCVGPIIFDLQGLEINRSEMEILQHPLIGGVIFFARNYESPQQITELTRVIRATKKTPILICVDQEGGRVQRFRDGFTQIPAMGDIKDVTLANACGYIIAAELLQVGVDLTFAPVVDLHKVDNPAINNRAFAANPNEVIPLAKSFIAGMQDAGMANCGKHFPGHGSVKIDSHVAMPEDLRELDQILCDDLLPFSEIPFASIMTSHILFSKVDARPVGFSEIWLQKILRERLHFSGIIFSDDLSMQGAVGLGDCVTRAERALQAGCDMTLICNSRNDVIKTLDHLPRDVKQVPIEKFSKLLGDFSVNHSALQEKRNILENFTLSC